VSRERYLVHFAESSSPLRWEIVNDGVMGGISKSRFFIRAGKTGVFEGELSLENYGGFASVRTVPRDFRLADHKGVALRVKGDGKRYRFRIRTDDEYEGIAYQVDFVTHSDQWETINFLFSDFTPVFRGRIIKDAPQIKPENIKRIGFMIADRQAGLFWLEIAWIKTY
jgi:monofunctional biosynthetic peptidoglycan transglycosylase